MPRARKALKTGGEGSSPAGLPEFILYLALAVSVFAAYANVYGNAFLFDDEQFILNNALLRSWHSIGAIFTSSGTSGAGIQDLYYRPLQTLLYLIFYQAFGLSTVAFHALNVTLHAANAGLLYALGRKLDFKRAAAFMAALIWAVHPVHTEAVTYMSATVDPLYAFFCLLGLVVLASDFSPQKFLLACPLYALALLSKESAIIFPLLAMACQFLASKNRLDPKIYLRAWPLFLVALAYIILRHFALGGGYEFYKQPNVYTEHFAYRVYTFLATLPAYAKLLAWPTCLHMDRNFPVYTDPWNVHVAAGAVMIVATLGQIAWGRGRRGLPLSFGLMWFAAAYVLNAGILLPVNGFFFEHWMYLPTAGFFLGAAQAIAKWLDTLPPKKISKFAVAMAVIAALVLGARTFDQNAIWRDPVTFYTHLIRCGTKSARVYNNLGNAYADRGETKLAIEQLRTAISLNDQYPQTHHNLALALLQLPDRDAHMDEVIAQLRRAIALDPDFFQSWELLANIYAYRGDRESAAACRAKAATIRQKGGIPADEYAQPVLAPNE